MFLLIILTVSYGELSLESIQADTRQECFNLQRWVKEKTMSEQKPVELYCMPVPRESFNEEQM